LQRVGLPLLVVAMLYLLVSNIWTQVNADEATEEKNAVQEQAKDAVSEVDQLCAEGGQVGRELDRRGACDEARDVLESPPPDGAAGPSREDIAAAVADYLRANPPPAGRPPTVGEVTAAVAGYLMENPPRPGRPPTPTEIATATADYLRAHPPASGVDGRDGVDGADAPPPSDEQIAAAVADYLREHPPPAGPQGERGPPGPTCPEGYVASSREYDPNPLPGDEETWWVCVADGD
jgi:hypothetical protein